MYSLLHPSLVNSPFGDPGLLVKFNYKNKAFLFDLGDISSLSLHQILSISHIFVTHTHIDHFFGFDRILRLFLGRNKKLYLYGPPGLFSNVEGKLSGYQWNLTWNYKQNFRIQVTEIHVNYAASRIYCCKDRFEPHLKKQYKIKNNVILLDNNIKIIATTLNHGIPCLGFSLQEQPNIKILPDKLEEVGLVPGKWITQLKQNLQSQVNSDFPLQLYSNTNFHNFSIKSLIKKITRIYPGQKITYITDVNLTKENKKAILKLAHQSTHLFIEAAFTTEHENMAFKKHHLTAKQAGLIARLSKSKKYTLFHHSPRYVNCQEKIKEEAELEYNR